MKIVGMMLVNLDTAAIGLPSRAAADLAGQPVLRRAVARSLSAKSLETVALLCPPAQQQRLGNVLGLFASDPRILIAPLPLTRAEIFGKLDPDKIRLARRWSLSGWRGGISGACWFDELLAPAAMTTLASQLAADAVALLCPEAAIADAALIDATIEQYLKHHERFRMAISQAPPGLGTICLAAPMLADLAATGQTLGRLLAYDPSNPRPYYVAGDATYKLPIDVIACPHRFQADTARGLALLEDLIRQLGDAPAADQSTRAATALFDAHPEPWPCELDVELTTQRAVADTLRPTLSLSQPSCDGCHGWNAVRPFWTAGQPCPREQDMPATKQPSQAWHPIHQLAADKTSGPLPPAGGPLLSLPLGGGSKGEGQPEASALQHDGVTPEPGASPLPDPPPKGRENAARTRATAATIDRLCDSIRASQVDDLVITLGGFGDALLHPDALEIAAKLKSAGALAVAVRTSLISLVGHPPSGVTAAPSPEPPASDLSFRDLTSLLDSPIDVLIVELDAATPEGYRRLKG
ncbi:MAG: hypothetical protein PHU85_18325, partial [Phycisphaerae bacterium]|nr:hypothetical protein [Phycisphaerae bacterium]